MYLNVQSIKNKTKENTPINFYTNYHREKKTYTNERGLLSTLI